MNKLAVCADIIIKLHERGYVHDFAFMGKNIWWVQESRLLRPEDLTVVECHGVTSPLQKNKISLIFGLVVDRHDAKGILIGHRRRSHQLRMARTTRQTVEGPFATLLRLAQQAAEE